MELVVCSVSGREAALSRVGIERGSDGTDILKLARL